MEGCCDTHSCAGVARCRRGQATCGICRRPFRKGVEPKPLGMWIWGAALECSKIADSGPLLGLEQGSERRGGFLHLMLTHPKVNFGAKSCSAMSARVVLLR